MLRDQFARELDYLWQGLRRFGERHPRLQALYAQNADPRVTRLVQSAAFAFASLHGRLHDDGQSLVRPLVAAAMPESLRPRPASTILHLTGGSSRPGAVFAGRAQGVDIPFELMWPVDVSAVALSNVSLERVDANLQVLHMTLTGRPGVVLGTILPDTLRVFVKVPKPAIALDLIQSLRRPKNRIRVKGWNAKGVSLETKLPHGSVLWPRIDTTEPGLVGAPADRFTSSTLLRDLYAFPESFCFFDLRVGELRNATLTRLELTLPLGRPLSGDTTLGSENLLLACGPATNQYRTPTATIHPAGRERRWPVSVAGRPHAEVLHVSSLRRVHPHNAREHRELVSWEAPASPHTFDPDDVYFILDQEVDEEEARTSTWVALASTRGFDLTLPGALIEGQALASDATLADSLGLGEVGKSQGATNVTRVAPSRRAPLGRNHAWRMNAYARMPPTRLVNDAHLAAFFALHDVSDARDEGARIHLPHFTKSAHARSHRLVDGMLEWGDAFSAELSSPDAFRGEMWLLGELLARAIAERNERVRFSTLALRRGDDVVGDYRARQGQRLPYPLG